MALAYDGLREFGVVRAEREEVAVELLPLCRDRADFDEERLPAAASVAHHDVGPVMRREGSHGSLTAGRERGDDELAAVRVR